MAGQAAFNAQVFKGVGISRLDNACLLQKGGDGVFGFSRADDEVAAARYGIGAVEGDGETVQVTLPPMVQGEMDVVAKQGAQAGGGSRAIDAPNSGLGGYIFQVEVVVEEDKTEEVAGDIAGIFFACERINVIGGGVEDQAVNHAAYVRSQNGGCALPIGELFYSLGGHAVD